MLIFGADPATRLVQRLGVAGRNLGGEFPRLDHGLADCGRVLHHPLHASLVLKDTARNLAVREGLHACRRTRQAARTRFNTTQPHPPIAKHPH